MSPQGAKHVAITLSLDGNGNPIATPEAGDPCHATDPEAACAWKNFKVTWKADPATRHWVVFFPSGTPFVNGDHVFTEKFPMGHINASPSEWKYWILYVNDQGEVKHSDPKLVIQPSRDLTAAEYGEWMHEEIAMIDAHLIELRDIVAEMSRTLSTTTQG
jgi:hypothetical protein